MAEWLFKEPIEIKNKKIIYNSKPLEQTAWKNIKTDDKQLNEQLAEKWLIYITLLKEC